MNRLLSLKQAAERIGNVSHSWLRRLAADRLRDPHNRHCTSFCRNPQHRRYPDSYHARYPVFVKDETGSRWCISEQALETHMARRIRRLEPSVDLEVHT